METQMRYSKTLSLEDFPNEVQSIVKEYECPLCKGIIYHPIVDSCGHIYCEKCFNLFLSTNNKYCPIDNTELSFETPREIQVVKGILEKQLIFCTNKKLDCKWKGLTAHYDQHINKDCPKQIINCINKGCSNEVKREELIKHLKVCDYRIEKCQHCCAQFSFVQLESHYEVCPKAIVVCPQKCGVDIVRELLRNQLHSK